MSNNIKQSLEEALTIAGAVGAAVVDWTSGMPLGMAGTALNMEIAAAGNTEMVRSKQRVMGALGIKDQIEDMLISLDSQYHLIRMMPSKPNLFVYLVLNRSKANLALARHKLAEIEQRVQI